MRWLAGIIGFALVLPLGSGCQQKVFLQEPDLRGATNVLYHQIEDNPAIGVSAISSPMDTPATVDLPDRPPRYLRLQEAIAMALENGTASSNSIGFNGLPQGIIDDTLTAGNRGLPNNQTDRIRVLSYNPAIAYTTVESSDSRFDVKFTSFLTYNVQDNFQLTNTLNGQFVNAGAYFFKELASGGVIYTGLGSTSAQNQAFQATLSTFANSSRQAASNQGSITENFYNIPLTIGIDQPLLRDFGVGINQLLNQASPLTNFLPGEGLSGFFNNQRLALSQGPNFNGLATPGILLARLQFDEARAEFERQVNNMLVNTEVAYWKLYQAYGSLYANEEVLRLAQRVWSIAQPRYAAGQLNPPYLLKNVSAQYQEFRNERLKALGQVLEAERNLRRLIGLKIEDGTRLIPITPPSMAPYRPNWYAAREDALALRPELVLARQNLKNAQYNLTIQKNFLKPDLRFVGQYQPTGFGNTLNGNASNFFDFPGGVKSTVGRPDNALRELASNHFDNWDVGLVFNVPIGYRLEYAGVRAARLGLAQSYAVLEDVETRTISILCLNYQKLYEWWDRIEISRSEHDSYADAVLHTWKRIKGGDSKAQDLPAAYLLLLDSQRRLALAMQKEYEAIAEYNSSLARFEWAKGTILHHDNVSIAEGPLPECVQGRAVDNEHQRTKALLLRERSLASPITHPGMLAGDKDLDRPHYGNMPDDANKNGGDGKPYTAPSPRVLPQSDSGPDKVPEPQAESAPSQETIPEMPKHFPPPVVHDREDRVSGAEGDTTGTLPPASPFNLPPEGHEPWMPDRNPDAAGNPPPLPGAPSNSEAPTGPSPSEIEWIPSARIPGFLPN